MDATTVAVDLAKSVSQLAVADANGRIVHKACLSRTQFQPGNHLSPICALRTDGLQIHALDVRRADRATKKHWSDPGKALLAIGD